ncbi:MAG: ice-binding family protein [Proteobacteria bacterium]|nr:ice-binding family protein [Pseudomonadota bacterium]
MRAIFKEISQFLDERKVSKIKCNYLILLIVALTAFLCIPLVSNASILNSAQSFAVLGSSTVTNDHSTSQSTQVYGNLGVTPGTSVTGFYPDGTVSGGTIHKNDGVAQLAKADATAVYNTLSGLPYDHNYSSFVLGSAGYDTLSPGVYYFSSSAQLTGALTLDGGGNADATWVFQIGSTLTTASDSSVNVINTGSGAGVYWQVGSSATLGTGTMFAGNIIALASVGLDPTAAILCGRAFALTGAVTLKDNFISNNNTAEDFDTGRSDFGSYGFSGGTPVPVPPTIFLLGSSILGLAGLRFRFKG